MREETTSYCNEELLVFNRFPDRYEDLPVLTPSDIKPKSVFSQEYQDIGLRNAWMRQLFIFYIALAIRQPKWLLNDRTTQSLEKARFGTVNDARLVGDLSERGTLEDVLVYAEAIQDRKRTLFSSDFDSDIMARAIQLMGEDYPYLFLYRGASYMTRMPTEENSPAVSKCTFSGFDFSPGSLQRAVDEYDQSVFTGSRRDPVLATGKFSTFGRVYSRGGVYRFTSEAAWWRDSLEIHFRRGEDQKVCYLYTLPDDPEQRKQIVTAGELQSIHITDELLSRLKERIAQKQ